MARNRGLSGAASFWRGLANAGPHGIASVDPPLKHALQLENVRLQERLTACELAADRQATLLNEADHRIKNSLQLVASMLRLQAKRGNDANASCALTAAALRISAIASIHDALQKSAGADMVDLGATLTEICLLQHKMAGEPKSIAVIVDAESIRAPVALAQPLLLAVNELVVNALRHAFHDDQTGVVKVSAHVVLGELRIVVSDDGVGLPADRTIGYGFGSKLVELMVAKIKGSISLDNSAGARFTIIAPAPNRPVFVSSFVPSADAAHANRPRIWAWGPPAAQFGATLSDFAPPVRPTSSPTARPRRTAG